MYPLVLWPLLIGIAPLSVPIVGHLIRWIAQILFPPRDEIVDLALPTRFPFEDRSRRLRIDGSEGKRLRPTRFRLPSR